MPIRTWAAPSAAAPNAATAARPTAPAPPPPAKAAERPAPPPRPAPLPDDPALLRVWAAAHKRVAITLRSGEVLRGRLVEVSRYALLVREGEAAEPCWVAKHGCDVIRAE